MARMKDPAKLGQKFVARAQGAVGDYTEGVRSAGPDWASATAGSEGNYEQGVQAAIADKRYGRGVAKAGPAKYSERAATLGAQRYPSGVATAANDWISGSQPYRDAASQELPTKRRPRGDAANRQRANEMAERLHRIRIGK